MSILCPSIHAFDLCAVSFLCRFKLKRISVNVVYRVSVGKVWRAWPVWRRPGHPPGLDVNSALEGLFADSYDNISRGSQSDYFATIFRHIGHFMFLKTLPMCPRTDNALV